MFRVPVKLLSGATRLVYARSAPQFSRSLVAGNDTLLRYAHHKAENKSGQADNLEAVVLSYPKELRHEVKGLVRPLTPAPDFVGQAVVNKQFKEIQLSKLKGKWVILFFYPLDFTFVCPTEIVAFSDRAAEFKALNCEVIACSTDSKFSHLAWINTPRKEGGLGDMQIPVLSDFTKRIASDYGVLLDADGVALRGLFLIDPEGIVRHVTVNDLPVGRSVDEALRILEAFQYVAKHGEVCPANWKPNSPTITPTPEKSKSYFQKVN